MNPELHLDLAAELSEGWGPPLYTRSPLFDDQWHLVNKPGYHAEAEIFLDGEPLRPRRRAPVLTSVLSEFCWRAPADCVGFIGALLTAITALIWVGRHPLVVLSANQSGVGKTLLARVLALLFDAAEHLIGFHADEEEFEKQLARQPTLTSSPS